MDEFGVAMLAAIVHELQPLDRKNPVRWLNSTAGAVSSCIRSTSRTTSHQSTSYLVAQASLSQGPDPDDDPIRVMILAEMLADDIEGAYLQIIAQCTRKDTLETPGGFAKILECAIVLGTDGTVGVRTPAVLSQVPDAELIRLWAHYETKIAYNLGYPENFAAAKVLGSVVKVVTTREIDRNTDCFARAGMKGTVAFCSAMPTSGTRITGEFYARGSLDRILQTYFPAGITEEQVDYSGLALMQHVISSNQADPDALRILTLTARNLLSLFQSQLGMDVEAVTRLPTLAYMQALGVA